MNIKKIGLNDFKRISLMKAPTIFEDYAVSLIRINTFSFFDLIVEIDDIAKGPIIQSVIECVLVGQGFNVGYNPPDVISYLQPKFQILKVLIDDLVSKHLAVTTMSCLDLRVVQRTPYIYDIIF